MNRIMAIALSVSVAAVWAQEPSLRGTVTDPSGAAVPGALVQLRGRGGEQRAKTGNSGQYSFPSLAPGKYQVRITAKGFSAAQKKDFTIGQPAVFDTQLSIRTEKQVLNVDDEIGRVSAEAESNGGAFIMRERQLAALSDDPDELALQLQALAGPAPGPMGGEIFIDGFSGGNLPPKSSIREVRINANPFSPEYDRPGFARVEIFTKPGSDSIRGQAFAQHNGEFLNSRNPLLAQSTRPPYRVQFYGFDISGPMKKNKASFTLGVEHRQIDENAFILATTLDSNLFSTQINQAVTTPQTRTTVRPRLDYAINPKNTLAARYQELRIALDNQGVGDFNLASRAYNEKQSERNAQITETAVIGPRAINETRFQYQRSVTRTAGGVSAAGINVLGAFYGGGATVGNSGSVANNWELTNITSYTKARHTFKWGGRARRSFVRDDSFNNFAGTFTFFTLERYQKTLELQRAGYSGAEIVQLGAGPSQFSLNAGTPETRLSQTDIGVFAGDDWRVRRNLTLSFGLRYEAQTNFGDLSNLAPRLGIAWGLGGKGNRPPKTVIRAGFGAFYDRLPLTLALNGIRYNGSTQQSFLILNPAFFPAIPAAATLAASRQPQQLRPVYSGIRAPRMYQTSIGVERQIDRYSRVTLTWIGTRGVHLLNARNINTPVGGAFPFGDSSIRLLSESAGFSRLNQVVVNANVTRRKTILFGYYTLSYGKDNNEGLPANPYDLRAEWGPSSYGDIRHRMVFGGTLPLPFRLSISPFLAANSGVPYNITTGLDPSNTGFPTERPALRPGAACRELPCFDPNPGPGARAIQHNYGRGPGAVNLGLRIAKTWSFGGEGQSGPADLGGPRGGGAGGHGGGPPAGMSGPSSGRRYNLTLGASTLNALNHPNFAPPNGVLSSPYFGEYRSLGGLVVMAHGGGSGAFNRKIDLQVRFTF